MDIFLFIVVMLLYSILLAMDSNDPLTCGWYVFGTIVSLIALLIQLGDD